jgi:hypothetical protein
MPHHTRFYYNTKLVIIFSASTNYVYGKREPGCDHKLGAYMNVIEGLSLNPCAIFIGLYVWHTHYASYWFMFTFILLMHWFFLGRAYYCHAFAFGGRQYH